MNNHSALRDVCVIIPTLNEKYTIEDLILTLEQIEDLILRIIVVDDGSTDGTLCIVESLTKYYNNIRLIERGMRLGFGTALIDGIKTTLNLKPRPEFIVTMDADLSHDPEELSSLVSDCSKGIVVVGSRYIDNGRIIGWGLKRKIMSKTANLLAQLLLRLPVRDYTSGYRCYSLEILEAILPSLKSQGFEIQIDTLREASRMGYSIVERPITFRDRVGGKSKLSFNDIFRFLGSITMDPT